MITKIDFKVYPRKIHVWVRQNSNVPHSAHTTHLIYMYSSNAFRTCKAALIDAKLKYPDFSFVANFDCTK